MLIVTACGAVVSCDSPQKRGLKELSRAGIEPSGRSLTEQVIKENPLAVGWLLDAGVHTEHRDAEGRTPLCIAIDLHDIDLATQLIEHGANVNATTRGGKSVLSRAVQENQRVLVERLLGSGAHVEGIMKDGEKVLPWAIREGRLSLVESMMKAGADPHMTDRGGDPLLQVAIKHGRREIMESLIELGADPGSRNPGGEGTLQLAIRQGWYDVLPKLAQAGADPNVPCYGVRTPLEHAIETQDLVLAAALLKAGADFNQVSSGSGETPLEIAIAGGSASMLEVFLQHGCMPPSGNWDPWLWQAYTHRKHEVARLLLKYGARAELRNGHGLLLMEQAVLDGEGNFVKLLADYFCPVGRSMIHAASRGSLWMLELLAADGVSYHAVVLPFLDTPLSAAVRAGQDRTAVHLLENDADHTHVLPEGQPLFLMAVAKGCPQTVKFLLKKGADPNMAFSYPVSDAFLNKLRKGVIRWALKNDRNVTPLMVAADSGVVQTAGYLLRAGARTEVWTRRSQLWPINFASRRGDVRMMRLILGKDPGKEPRQIVIRLSEQKARLYDAVGNEIFTTSVSTGKKGFSTPTGEYVITNKHRDWTSTLYHASMPFFQRLSCSDFGLHQGVVPGYPASHGCIRVPAGNAAKLFTMTEAGDRVRIVP